MADLDLTLVFEFEFVCIYRRNVFTRGLTTGTYKSFQTRGYNDNFIQASHAIQIYFDDASIDIIGWDDGDLMIKRPTESYTKWRIDYEANFLSEGEQAHLPEGYICESIKLASPKFRLTDHWLGGLRRMLSRLDDMGRLFGCDFVQNESTGFHVQVGNNTQPIPFKTCKKLFQLVTAHEQTLDLAHSAGRINTISELESRQVLPCFDPPSFLPCFAPPSFFLRRADPTTRDPTIFSRLQQIEHEAVDFPSLRQLFHLGDPISRGRDSAYNFDNCFYGDKGDEGTPNTGTIEFRQHRSTFRLYPISAWTDVVVHLVLFSHHAPLPKFLQILVSSTEPATEHGQDKLISFLREIGCHADTIEYYGQEYGKRNPHRPTIGDLFGVPPNTDEEDHRTDGLAEINDVQAKILRKFQDLDYGLRPTAAPMRVSEDAVEDLYREICAKFDRISILAGLIGFSREKLYAMAMEIFFARMHEMYSASDGASAGRWKAIKRRFSGRLTGLRVFLRTVKRGKIVRESECS